MTEGPDIADWTTGAPALAYQHCPDCDRAWYFRRTFCPHCGSQPETREASGRGTVYAATLVTRAPSDALRALAPYRILLVDAQEGIRLMAHGALDIAVGDPVQARFDPFGPLLIPVFERRSDP